MMQAIVRNVIGFFAPDTLKSQGDEKVEGIFTYTTPQPERAVHTATEAQSQSAPNPITGRAKWIEPSRGNPWIVEGGRRQNPYDMGAPKRNYFG